MSGRLAARAAYLLVLVMVVAGLTHLTAVLTLPGRDHASAYAVLVAELGGTSLKTQPEDVATGAFRDPALPSAACLYDLRQGPVSARLAVTDDAFAVLSVHDRHGRVLAGLTSRSARNGQLGLVVVKSGAATAGHSDRTIPAAIMSDLHIEVNEPMGFVLAEVLAAEPSEQAQAATMAAAMSCRPAEP